MKTSKREEVTGNKAETDTQVYLRWVGVRGGEPFTSTPSGPWGVSVSGYVMLFDKADHEQLEHERGELATRGGVTGLRLMVSLVEHGVLVGWNDMGSPFDGKGGPDISAQRTKALIETAHATAHAKLDVCGCQCLTGGECGRKICTGAYKLERLCAEDDGVCDRCAGASDKPCADAKEPLPPCPFCGSHEVSSATPMGSDWWVQCAVCGAGTAIFATEAEAEAAWRRREMKPEEAEVETDILVACCVAAMPALDRALEIAGGALTDCERQLIANIVDAANALTGGEVPNA